MFIRCIAVNKGPNLKELIDFFATVAIVLRIFNIISDTIMNPK